MKKPIIFLLIVFSMIFVCPIGRNFCGEKIARCESVGEAETISVSSKSALLLDFNSNTVIYEKNSHSKLPIASMTKIVTLSLVFDALEHGFIHEDDMISVSQNAASVGGSSAFLDAGSRYKLTDLIKTVVVASANDSSVALAEYVSGSEEVFVKKMNKLASSLNLCDTHFENCTGLPSKNHYSSAYDIARLYMTICDNKIYRKYSKIWTEDFIHPSGRKTGLVNTNKMVKTFDGIEGGKTGYTDSAKFCLTASAKRGNMRLIGVIIGAQDSKTRFFEMSKMLNYGFANFSNKVVVSGELPVTVSGFKKSKQVAEIFPQRDVIKFLPKTDDSTFTTDFVISKVSAPLKAGDTVGKLYVFDKNNMVVDEVDLIVKKDIEAEKFADIFKRLSNLW